MDNKKVHQTKEIRGWLQNKAKLTPTRNIIGSYQINRPSSHQESARHDLGIEVMKNDIVQVALITI